MSKSPSRFVRFYFKLAINAIIPKRPEKHGGSEHGKEWEACVVEELAKSIGLGLRPMEIEIAYRKHELVDSKYRVYQVEFNVSKLCKFKRSQVVELKTGFSVKNEAFASARSSARSQIQEIISRSHVVKALRYEFATSRIFALDASVLIDIKIAREITEEDVAASGGYVREAIKDFISGIELSLSSLHYDVNPTLPPHRRPKSNIYEFKIRDIIPSEYEENEFEFQNFALLGKNFDIRLLEFGRDFDKAVLTNWADVQRHRIEQELLTDIVEISFHYWYGNEGAVWQTEEQFIEPRKT